MKVPETLTEFNFVLALFLCLISINERLLVKFYTPLWFSFYILVLGLLIFDTNSIFYSLFYFGTGFIFTILRKKGTSLINHLSANSIGIIAIILCNEYYNQFTNQSFFYRYITFIFLLILSMILVKVYNYLEFNMSHSSFINIFLPLAFKMIIIFPILSIYNYFNFFIITLMLMIYIYFLNFCRKRLLAVSDIHVQELIELIKKKHHLDIFFMDLGSIKGMYYPKKGIIAIDEKLDYPEQLQTIVHEYLHHLYNKNSKYHFLFEELLVTISECILSWVLILKLKKGAAV